MKTIAARLINEREIAYELRVSKADFNDLSAALVTSMIGLPLGQGRIRAGC